jgi:hypothetical protein
MRKSDLDHMLEAAVAKALGVRVPRRKMVPIRRPRAQAHPIRRAA